MRCGCISRALLQLLFGTLLLGLSKEVLCFAATENPNNLTVAAHTETTSAFEKCLDTSGSPMPATSQDFADGRPSRLLLHQVWLSSKTPQLPQPTVFTALTPNRLHQLKAQCQHWPGPLSAALYVPVDVAQLYRDQSHDNVSKMFTQGDKLDPLLQQQEHEQQQQQQQAAVHATGVEEYVRKKLRKTAAAANALHAQLKSQPNSCALDLMLLYELVSSSSLSELLPINLLRNYAALMAKTELVAMIDVDLLPSRTLARYLMEPDNLQQLEEKCANKTVVVLPAFQTAPQLGNESAGHELAARAAAVSSKANLRQLMEQQLVFQFHMTHYRQGHDCTNYDRWLSSNEYYSVRHCWSMSYEPWFIINRRVNPLYDEVFRGYGWNKLSHVVQTYYEGFDFQVIPEGFLVHRQHQPSAASRQYLKGHYSKDASSKEHNLKNVVDRFKKRVLQQLKNGTYQPVVDEGLQSCMQQLPWWQTSLAGEPRQQQLENMSAPLLANG